jgi:ubiquinone/menaquinone biosynthesis C-methylase UbiE
VVGVDIAPSMIELAEEMNRHGGRCRYVLNGEDNLRVFPESFFDLIYSNITLQH